MPSFDIVSLLVGSVLAAVLVAIGFWFGRQKSPSIVVDAPLLDENDRQRMVTLLQGLTRWTSEYSGSLSQYQSEVERFNEAVKQTTVPASRGGDPRVAPESVSGDAKLMRMVADMMTTNQTLKDRLTAAEKQLDSQTRQIEAYLTEARTDGLTGLANRRAFDKRLDELFAIYRGGGSPFVLGLVDIDHFKMINDRFGHPVGDAVLQGVATRFQEELADALIIARFGGEEFSILLDDPLRIAAERFNQVRKRFASEPFSVNGVSIPVTISVGLTQPFSDLIIGPMVRRADEALYSAKNMGRNRVYYNAGNGPQLLGAPEIVRS